MTTAAVGGDRAVPGGQDAPTGSAPHFPSELVRPVRLADGRVVLIRPVLPADAERLRAAVERADPDTLRRRFLGGPPPSAPADFERLTTLDFDRRLALAAFAPDGQGAGIARYECRPGDDVAEVAVAVDPDWRRVGLAATLLRMLAEAAVRRGITAFAADYFVDNEEVARLVRGFAVPVQRHHDREVTEEVIELRVDE